MNWIIQILSSIFGSGDKPVTDREFLNKVCPSCREKSLCDDGGGPGVEFFVCSNCGTKWVWKGGLFGYEAIDEG